jgi:hypothetical protein
MSGKEYLARRMSTTFGYAKLRSLKAVHRRISQQSYLELGTAALNSLRVKALSVRWREPSDRRLLVFLGPANTCIAVSSAIYACIKS